jgi:hypothetical protein
MLLPRWTLAFVPLLGVLAGCTDQESPAKHDPDPGPDLCAAMNDECFSRQRVCVAGDEGPTCEPCGSAQYASPEGVCEALPGTALQNKFADFTIKAGTEVKGLCQSWTLHNKEDLWVNAVELLQSESSHHSNWTFVPDDKFTGPDGVWDCDERNYSQLSAAVSGGVIYAQSTQAVHEVQKFPNGAAVRIPRYSRIIGDVHLLNTTADDITGNAELTLYTLKESEVAIKLAPFHFTYEGLEIPPHADSRFRGECALDSKFTATGNPFKMDIYFVLPHYHALGKAFFLDTIGGAKDGERIFEVGAYDGEAHGKNYDPPYSLTDATGLAFGCDFTNPRNETIHYGLGDQEMCEMLGFADSKVAFEARVDSAEAAGSDGSTQVFTGPCSAIAFEWSQDKPGGKGP